MDDQPIKRRRHDFPVKNKKKIPPQTKMSTECEEFFRKLAASRDEDVKPRENIPHRPDIDYE